MKREFREEVEEGVTRGGGRGSFNRQIDQMWHKSFISCLNHGVKVLGFTLKTIV